MWAEEFGIGEMNLSPDGFWSLTPREFGIKHAAFARSEDRWQALVIDLALRTADYKDADRDRLMRVMHALRQYPQKSWLK